MSLQFAVIVATYYRKNGKTKFFIERMLKSLENQTFKDFKVFIIGDNYADAREFDSIIKSNTLNIFKYNNLKSCRNGYFRIPINKWSSGGIFARFYGINKAMNEGYKYYLHLDDDDIWENFHIETIRNAIINFPLADFIYTKSKFYSKILPDISTSISQSYNNLLPTPRQVVHSTWCINLHTLGNIIIDLYRKRIARVESFKINPRKEFKLQAFDKIILSTIKNYSLSGKTKIFFVNKVTCQKENDVNIPI